jgi:integrase
MADICKGDALDLIDLMVGTGLRWGEVSALQVRDITVRGHHTVLRVQRAWKRQENNVFLLGKPKTKKSRRTVVLSPALVEIVQRNREGKKAEDFIFTTAWGKAWRHANFFYRRWQPAVEDAQKKGLTKKPRPHDLRHTHVAWLIAANVPLPAIQARLGHESITTTVDRYGHLVQQLDDEVAAAVEAAMTGERQRLRAA